MAILYGIPAFVFCLVVVPTSAQNLLRCTYRENDRSTTCRGGTWPAAGETPDIDAETTELALWDIAFQKDNVAAIPILPNLEKLSIADSNWQAEEGTVKLPFKELLRNANRPALLELGIDSSRYGSVDEQEFAGFTSLRKLVMRNNTLSGIHVKAFGEKVGSCQNLSAVLEVSLIGNGE